MTFFTRPSTISGALIDKGTCTDQIYSNLQEGSAVFCQLSLDVYFDSLSPLSLCIFIFGKECMHANITQAGFIGHLLDASL